jgi:predicted RNase H-like HicB family nuclease
VAIEAAVRVDLPVAGGPESGQLLTGVAVHEGGQWASLCPELDIASVGASPDEAIDRLVAAVAEALQFAQEEGLEAGQPTPSDSLREFMIGSDSAFYVRRFYV